MHTTVTAKISLPIYTDWIEFFLVYTECKEYLQVYTDCHFISDLNVLVPSLMNELRNDLFASESEILTSRDYAELVNILDELTKVNTVRTDIDLTRRDYAELVNIL